jgi:hypothetical protein
VKKTIIWISLIALIPVFVSASIFPKTGTAAMQFLKLGVDARAIGMGEAYTAVTNDISSVYWNPAGLALNNKKQMFISHANYVADIYQEFVATSIPTNFGTMAIYSSILHMADQDVVDADTFGPTGETFSFSDIEAGISYSNMFTDKFSLGMTVKYLRENAAEESQNGFAVDLGTLYNTKWHNTIIGMALKNFGPDVRYKVDNDGDGKIDEDPFDLLDNDGDGLIDEDRKELGYKIPMNYSLGISTEIYKDLTVSGQLDNCVDRSETWNLGAEYRINVFALRSGYHFGQDTQGITAGFGVKLPMSFAIINIDYAYTNMGDLEVSFAKSAHRVSLKLAF